MDDISKRKKNIVDIEASIEQMDEDWYPSKKQLLRHCSYVHRSPRRTASRSPLHSVWHSFGSGDSIVVNLTRRHQPIRLDQHVCARMRASTRSASKLRVPQKNQDPPLSKSFSFIFETKKKEKKKRREPLFRRERSKMQMTRSNRY